MYTTLEKQNLKIIQDFNPMTTRALSTCDDVITLNYVRCTD